MRRITDNIGISLAPSGEDDTRARGISLATDHGPDAPSLETRKREFEETCAKYGILTNAQYFEAADQNVSSSDPDFGGRDPEQRRRVLEAENAASRAKTAEQRAEESAAWWTEYHRERQHAMEQFESRVAADREASRVAREGMFRRLLERAATPLSFKPTRDVASRRSGAGGDHQHRQQDPEAVVQRRRRRHQAGPVQDDQPVAAPRPRDEELGRILRRRL